MDRASSAKFWLEIKDTNFTNSHKLVSNVRVGEIACHLFVDRLAMSCRFGQIWSVCVISRPAKNVLQIYFLTLHMFTNAALVL